VETVAAALARYGVQPLVVDPVMVAKSGDSLLSREARSTLKSQLLPLALVVTPNLPEAEVLSGRKVRTRQQMADAAKKIYDLGPRYVLVKGGHLEGEAVDLLYDGERVAFFASPRLRRRNTHGTGCTFSAALTTLLTEGMEIHNAVDAAKRFITRAISHGIAVGAGQGPTNPYAHILGLKEAETVKERLRDAAWELRRHPLGRLIPEVRSNFGYALPAAADYEEVAAFPGRISQIGDRLLVWREPRFGASRHIARVILAAATHFGEIRSAMNIRFEASILDACRRAGLAEASFDRLREPQAVKEREGSTLEWGTRLALQGLETAPDIVYDRGDVGKEPMIRVLGTTPGEVVEKIIRIWRAVQNGS
jgi:hydroxymethylpyrimidine/phosphomethylpyrimidine kinase